MGHLQLALLGTPLVQHDGRGVKFPTRKALALLIHLAVEGAPISREKLITLLRPESDTVHGRTALRTTLTHLRDALNEKPDAPHLLIEQDTLTFSVQSDFELDLRAVEAVYERTRQSPVSNLTLLRGQLASAIALYRGNFLEGFSLNAAPEFDDWTGQQRETWHQRLNTLFDRLTQLQFEGGEAASGIETATHWLARDPLNETAYRRVMRLHMAAGNRPAALRAYENCRAVLQRELNADPSPETEALAERIQAQTLEVEAELEPEHPLAIEVPLVGRLNEHTALASAYCAARRGASHVVTIVGEPGIGKTRLAKEFIGWAAAQGADVLQGQAFETGGPLLFHPIVQALRARLAREPEVTSLLDSVWLNELTRLLPELRAQLRAHVGGSTPPSAADEGEARLRLFEAIAQLIQSLARRAPLVLFVDDLHWADAASRDLVHYLSRRCAETNAPVLLIVTLRSEELSGALQEWLLTIERAWPSRRVALSPLTLEDTRQIAGAFLARQEPWSIPELDAFAQRLFTETAGQPLFVVEALRAWLDEGGREVAALPLALGALAPGIQALIQARISRLSALGRTLLAAAAVLAQDLRAGQSAEAEAMVQAGLPDLNSENLFPLSRVMLASAAIELALTSHDYPRALSLSDRLIELLHQIHMRIFIPSTMHFKAKAPYNLGEHDTALEMLGEARAEAEAMGARWSLWPILNTLSDIEAQRGHDVEARVLRQQAQHTLTYIADHTSNAIRTSLLNWLQIRALMTLS
jgi:DNA-binding SARP family transcriptional activator